MMPPFVLIIHLSISSLNDIQVPTARTANISTASSNTKGRSLGLTSICSSPTLQLKLQGWLSQYVTVIHWGYLGLMHADGMALLLSTTEKYILSKLAIFGQIKVTKQDDK